MDALLLENQKRTRALFDPDLALPPEEDPSAVRMKLKMKIRAEYSNALELPPALIRREQAAREKRLREQIEQQQQQKQMDLELSHAEEEKQSLEQVTIEELIDEGSTATQLLSARGAHLSATGAGVVALRDQIINGSQASNKSMQLAVARAAVPLKPGEVEVPTSRSALVRTQIHLTPKPAWHAPWKLMRVISGHLGWVRCVAVDSSNQWFATGAADRVIKIWDMASGTLKLSLTGHISTVRGLAVSPRHPYLFSCGEDKQIKCWDLETNKVIRHYHGHLSAVYSIALHPTLDVLITGSRDSVARVWDMRTRQSIHVLSGHTQTVSSIIAQEADPQVITGSMDSTVRLWDLAAGKSLAVLTHHKKSVRALASNPNQFTFASASPENIKQWKCPEAKFIQNFSGHRSIINTMSCNQDNVLVSGGDNGSLYFWDWNSGYNFQRMETIVQPGSLDSEAGIFCSAFDRSGARLITGEADKTIKIWREDETASPDTHPITDWRPSLKKDHY